MSVVLGEQAAFLMESDRVGAGPTIAPDGQGTASGPPDDAAMTPSPPRRARRRRVAVIALLALLAVPLVALLSHPWWLAGWLSSYLSETSGREVRFDRVRLGLSDTMAPQARFEGVRIANAAWTGSSQPFAVLREATFQFAWHRFDGRWLVTRMILRDGEVHLHRQADGRRNWRLRDPEDRGPGHFWFQSMEPQRIALSFVHEAGPLELRTRASALAPLADTSPEAGPAGQTGTASQSRAAPRTGTASQPPVAPLANRIDFDGRWRGMPFAGRIDTGPEITFFESGRWFPLRGEATVGGARLGAEGRAADFFRGLKIDVAATASGNSLAGLGPLIGARSAEPRAFRADGRLIVDDAVYAVKAARAKVGSTDLAGELAWSRAGDRPKIRARLASEAADLADLLWLAGRAAPAASAAPARSGQPAPAVSAAAASAPPRDAFARARELDAEVAFQAKRLRIAAVPLVQSLKLDGRLADGRLAVSGLDVGWGGGHSTGTIGVDLRSPAPRAEAELETRGVRIETLFPTSDEKRRVTGALRTHASLKAAGADLEALRASLTGKVTATLSQGTIPSLLDAQMGLEVGKVMRSFLTGSSALPLPCAAATAELGGGLARITSLVIDSANTRITGAGVVDLRHGVVDIKLTSEPKRPGLLELQKSIRLSGKPPELDKSLVERLPPLKATPCDGGKP